MSNVHASIGITQFKRKEQFFRKRKSLAKYYDFLLKESDLVNFFSRNYHEIVPHIYPVLINNKIDKIDFIKFLNQNGIQVGIHYKPNHFLSFFESKHNFPNTEKLYSKLLSLPLHTLLSKRHLRYIVNVMNSYNFANHSSY